MISNVFFIITISFSDNLSFLRIDLPCIVFIVFYSYDYRLLIVDIINFSYDITIILISF